jgi:integrase
LLLKGVTKGDNLQFTDNIFAQQLSQHLSDEKILLLNRVVSSLSPTPAFLNIAHQLQTLLAALTHLSTLSLPNDFQENNDRVIALLTKLVVIETFKKRILNESLAHSDRNPIHGNIKDHPVATLFSLSFNTIQNENTRQVFYCATALTFWLSFNGAPVTKVDGRSKLLRKVIETYPALILNNGIASLTLAKFINKWDGFLSKRDLTGTAHDSIAKQIKELSEFPVRATPSANMSNKPQKPRISNITPARSLSPRTNTKVKKRRYVPVLKHKEDVGEDDSIDLVDVSVDTTHYIDDEALNQSYLYGSRLALQDLMQLSLRPVALIDHEVQMVTQHIKQALASDNELESIDATLALISLCTSKGYEYIEALPVNRYENKEVNGDCICLETQTWNRLDIRMPGAFAATDEQKEHLEKIDHLVKLPLPTLLITALDKRLKESGSNCTTVKTLCAINQSELSISQRIASLFKDSSLQGRHVTPASIRNLLFESISKQESAAVASLLLANTEYASNTPLYYLFQSHQKVTLIYQRCLTNLGFDTNDISVASDAFCGSELAIKRWHSQLIINEKYNEITNNYDDIDDRSPLSSLIQMHNQITLYSALVLLITTGHRSRKEYSFSGFTIDELKQLICIADKENFCDSALRILPLANVALENIKAYRTHCDRLSRLMVKHDPLLTQQLLKTSQGFSDINQPMLYLINEDLTTGTVGFENIETYLAEWNLPANAFRHYFFSFLQSTNARTIAINFMGHIRAGEHVYNNESLFCNDDMQRSRIAINGLAESLNCQPLMFTSKAGRRVPLKDTKSEPAYIPQYIKADKAVNKRQLRRSVRKSIETASSENKLFFKDIMKSKEVLISEIISDEKLTKSILSYKLKILDKFIARMVGTKKLHSITKTFSDSESSGLTLRNNSLFKASEAQAIKEVLQNWVLDKAQNEEITKHAANREFIKIVLSFIVHSAFSFTIDTEFIRALKKPMFRDGNILWLTWVDSQNIKQRIFIDAVTAQLIINNPVYLKTKLKHPSELSKTLYIYLATKLKKLRLQQKLIGKKKVNINKLVTSLNHQLFFTHSGLVQSYLNMKQVTTHLPDAVLTRWLRDSPCYKAQVNDVNEVAFTTQTLVPPKPAQETDTSVILGTEILIEIRDKLNHLQSKSGHTSSKELMSIVANSWENAVEGHFNHNLQEMINQSEQLTETTIAVLCWLYYTAGKPGKGRKTIAIKTLLNYISKVAKPLIITADTQRFFTLTKSELQSLYIDVIASRKVKSKAEAAEVLRVFGNYSYDNFKIQSVSWLEIEPSIKDKSSNVRANMFSYREYKEVQQLLSNDPTFSQDEILINKTLFTLCSRLGLRISEAENLMVNEIDFNSGIIHIKTNRYDRVKSENANRRLPMTLFLSPEEINNLKQLVQRALLLHAQKRNVGIFARPINPNILIDLKPHREAITQAMKKVTNDPSVTLHTCRHTFANYLYLLVCRGELPPSINQELLSWSREKQSYQHFTHKLISELLKETFSAHKILHAISLMLGHEDVATTIKHYIHVLDIISAAESDKNLNQQLQIKQVKWVNKLPISNASKIVSRFDSEQRRHTAISYHQLKKANGFREVDVIRTNSEISSIIQETPHIKRNTLLYNLSMIEVVIRSLENKISINEIANKVTFTEIEIANIINICEQLKSQTAYDGVLIHSSAPNIELHNNPAQSLKTKAYPKAHTYKKILDKLNSLSEEHRDSLVKIWVENYNRNTTGYTIINPIDMQEFYSIINRLGYRVNIKDDHFTVKDSAKKVDVPLLEIIDQSVGNASNSINLKFNHALFLLAINTQFITDVTH